MNQNLSFLKFYEKEPHTPFYVILSLFIFTNMLRVIYFTKNVMELMASVRLVVNAVLMAACAMYTAFNIVLWRLKPVPAAAAVGILALTGFGWNFIGQTNEFFSTAVAMFLALLAYRRDFRVILKIVLVCHFMTLLVGFLGLYLGYSKLAYKIDSTDIGYSMGLIYPNHVGRIAFLIFMIAWYLWGQKKQLLTAGIAIVLSLLMWFVVECKTITIFLIGFPVCWRIVTWIRDRKTENCAGTRAVSVIRNVFLIPMPFLCLGLTWILGKNRAFFMRHWHYGQGIFSLWMRFISAGVLFKTYGFPLLGRDILEENAVTEIIEGRKYLANIVDNAYIYYLVALGGIVLVICMLWLSLGNYRALRNRDSALLLISVFMCAYGLIEVVYFQFEHNFLFFYPLTAAALAYKGRNAAAEELEAAEDPAEEQEVSAPEYTNDKEE